MLTNDRFPPNWISSGKQVDISNRSNLFTTAPINKLRDEAEITSALSGSSTLLAGLIGAAVALTKTRRESAHISCVSV
ncbi:hypothetical protein J6590_089409 [Homalodisca vitripennis]|nr:hypothetical protein J6590_089409 [Homalodisca vitripennis]